MSRYAKLEEGAVRMSHSEIERLCADVEAMDAEFGGLDTPASRMVRAVRQLLAEAREMREPAPALVPARPPEQALTTPRKRLAEFRSKGDIRGEGRVVSVSLDSFDDTDGGAS